MSGKLLTLATLAARGCDRNDRAMSTCADSEGDLASPVFTGSPQAATRRATTALGRHHGIRRRGQVG
jgi:hypothetical protein